MAEAIYIQSDDGAVQHVALHESKQSPGQYWSACGRVKAPALGRKYVGQMRTCGSCLRVLRAAKGTDER